MANLIVTVANTKGGVGKSTIATNLAVEAASEGKNVLIIDADTQGSSIAWRSLRQSDDITAMANTTDAIHKDVAQMSKAFDIVIIDAGGRDSKPFRSAVLACSRLLIPIMPSQYDVWGAADTLEVLRLARTVKQIDAWFVLNQVVTNTKIGKEARVSIEELKDEVGLLETVLHARVAFKNIDSGRGVTEVEPSGKAADEIRSLYAEFILGRKTGPDAFLTEQREVVGSAT